MSVAIPNLVDWAAPINRDLVILSLGLPGASGGWVWPNLANRKQGSGGTTSGAGGGDVAWYWRGNQHHGIARHFPSTAGGVEGWIDYDSAMTNDDGTRPVTVRVRYRPYVSIGIDYTLFGRAVSNWNIQAIHRTATSKIEFTYVDSSPAGNTLTSASTFSFTPSSEYDIVCIWAGASKTAKLFVNGVLEASGTAPALNLRATTGVFRLGNWGNVFGGLRDSSFSEVAAWYRALSDDEVKLLYRNRNPATDPRLIQKRRGLAASVAGGASTAFPHHYYAMQHSLIMAV